jgi:hypothetical protein
VDVHNGARETVISRAAIVMITTMIRRSVFVPVFSRRGTFLWRGKSFRLLNIRQFIVRESFASFRQQMTAALRNLRGTGSFISSARGAVYRNGREIKPVIESASGDDGVIAGWLRCTLKNGIEHQSGC